MNVFVLQHAMRGSDIRDTQLKGEKMRVESPLDFRVKLRNPWDIVHDSS